jgi:uncharacterized protein (DUF1697 family)
MPGRFVALLRGVNVGRAKRVAMADLAALVEGLGYANAKTLLNSGNVFFEAPRAAKGDPAARIEKALAAKLGIVSRVTVLTAAELAAIVAGDPFRSVADDPSRYLLAVLYGPAGLQKLKPLATATWAPERLAIGKRWAYLWCADGILASKLLAEVGRTLKDGVTTRNWATIAKLHALAGAP